jgi:hypothetical protein
VVREEGFRDREFHRKIDGPRRGTPPGTYLWRQLMKKKTKKKLVLSKETVRSLKEAEKLKLVAGGFTVVDRLSRCCPPV